MNLDRNPHSPLRTSCSEKLMSIVSTKIYKNNPFRILGLSPEASLTEAQKKAEKLMMMKRLGINEPQSSCPEANEQDIRDAIEALRDPLKRIIYEIFWYHAEKAKTKSDSQDLSRRQRK